MESGARVYLEKSVGLVIDDDGREQICWKLTMTCYVKHKGSWYHLP